MKILALTLMVLACGPDDYVPNGIRTSDKTGTVDTEIVDPTECLENGKTYGEISNDPNIKRRCGLTKKEGRFVE